MKLDTRWLETRQKELWRRNKDKEIIANRGWE